MDKSVANSRGIGILGGTFDPVHFGHLRSALDVMQKLSLSQVRLVPNAVPPHRDQPEASTAQRLAMLALATECVAGLQIDDRECQRKTVSYTIETLKSFRKDYPATPLYLLMGIDAFAFLDTWYQWDNLLDYAHIALMTRPYQIDLSQKMRGWLEQHLATQKDCCLLSGKIWPVEVTPLAITATDIRQKAANNLDIHYLLPEKVVNFIQMMNLYRERGDG